MLKPLRGASLNFTHPLARGLIGYWLFNEGGGSRFFDLTRNNNFGVHVPVILWERDVEGWSVRFNGVNKHVTVDNESFFDVIDKNNPFSISVSTDPDSPSVGALVAKMGPNPFVGWQLYYNSSNYLRLQLTGSGGSLILDNNPSVLVGGVKNHIGASYDGSADISGARLYVNGIENTRTETENALTASFVTNEPLMFAARNNGAEALYEGKISWIKLWNRKLSQSEFIFDYLYPYAMFEIPLSPGIFGDLPDISPLDFDRAGFRGIADGVMGGVG